MKKKDKILDEKIGRKVGKKLHDLAKRMNAVSFNSERGEFVQEEMDTILQEANKVCKEVVKNKDLSWRRRLEWAILLVWGKARSLKADVEKELFRFGAWLFMGWKE